MKETPPHLRTIEEIEQISIPGLVEVLREKGFDKVQAVLWDATGWHNGSTQLGEGEEVRSPCPASNSKAGMRWAWSPHLSTGWGSPSLERPPSHGGKPPGCTGARSEPLSPPEWPVYSFPHALATPLRSRAPRTTGPDLPRTHSPVTLSRRSRDTRDPLAYRRYSSIPGA